MARSFNQSSRSLYPEVPTGNGFCLYIRRECFEKTGLFDSVAYPRGYGEENDYCLRASSLGFSHIIDDRTLIYHRRLASFGDDKFGLYADGQHELKQRYPQYPYITSVFSSNTKIRAAKLSYRKALDLYHRSGERPRPRVAFVISTQTGGTPQTNKDLMNALSDRYECWVLRCDSKVVEVKRVAENRIWK